MWEGLASQNTLASDFFGGLPVSKPVSTQGTQETRIAVGECLCRAIKNGELIDKPGSVVGNHLSRATVARGLKQPTRESTRRTAACRTEVRAPPLFGFAPGGVYQAR